LFVFAGGGSGGHLYPGLAVANELSEMDSGNRVLFLTTEREIDSEILGKYSYEQLAQPIRAFPNRVGKVIPFFLGWRRTLRMIEH